MKFFSEYGPALISFFPQIGFMLALICGFTGTALYIAKSIRDGKLATIRQWTKTSHKITYGTNIQPAVIRAEKKDGKITLSFDCTKGILGVTGTPFIEYTSCKPLIKSPVKAKKFDGRVHDPYQLWIRHNSGVWFAAEVKEFSLLVPVGTRLFLNFCVDTRGHVGGKLFSARVNGHPLTDHNKVHATLPRYDVFKRQDIAEEYYVIEVVPLE